MVDLNYLKMTGFQKFRYRLGRFFKNLPKNTGAFLKRIPHKLGRGLRKFAGIFTEVFAVFKRGDWKTRTSFFAMGFGQIARGQILRGILYLAFELIFIAYMIFFGWKYLVKLGSLGDVALSSKVDPETGLTFNTYIDNSMLILLYGLLTVFFIIAFIYVWRQNCIQNGETQKLSELGFRLDSARDDIRAMADKQYHKTLLATPLLGILIFTVIPVVFMVLVAFTNYDSMHQPPAKLFDWVGTQNFATMFGVNSVATGTKFGFTFGSVLIWTLIWAFFATFSNYFLGMLVALMINKKGIKGKRIFRTILVMTIAVPQFISLLLVSKMFAEDGIVNGLLLSWGVISEKISWLTTGGLARVMVILINIWVGIPYLMLIATGILMNIPEDLYESAKIDGASPFRTYMKITLPYMLFVTTPYLITSFIANINNFNVIYLLTAGAPYTLNYESPAGYTDLLITWLYKLTMTQTSNYKMASVIGIMVFVVVAVFSLIVYNRSRSVKDEEDFQ
ncbi:MAG TPA: sugar ABC transporter permease [Oscillospiraceae bacterium]|nr:sugar ABC transporter permease [Oscillospiraceae bacterium]HPS34709.1 sugar ABC transporter permease [Oscillospiraceae bacterium]